MLKLCKSWYETRFFADRAVIAAILLELELHLKKFCVEKWNYHLTLSISQVVRSEVVPFNEI